MPDELTIDRLVSLALDEFQKLLFELQDEKLFQGNDSGVKGIYVERNKRFQDSFASDSTDVTGQWLVTKDCIEKLAFDSSRPLPDTLQDFCYEQGYGYFSISEDYEIRLGWQVGPRFGRGYRYRVAIDENGNHSLCNKKEIWAS